MKLLNMITLGQYRVGLIAIFLLLTALLWASLSEAAPSKSDLNKDGVVDYDDLVIFSAQYLEQDAGSVDWCAFIEATGQEEDLYGRSPAYFRDRYGELLAFTSTFFGCVDYSDINNDGRYNSRDLMEFSEQYAGTHFLLVDWCEFLQNVLDGESQFDNPADYYLNHYGLLLLHIQDKYKCSEGPPPVNVLMVENDPKFLTRIAASQNPSGNYYVTDAKVGSVFIYDSNFTLTGELKGLEKPLGIAVNASGHILVGNDKRNKIEVYDPANGALLASFGASEIETPSSITLDSQGRIYVTDAGSNTIYVYDHTYELMTNIGERGKDPHQFRSPSNALLSPDETELFVLDRLNVRVQVYDLEGNWVRTITFAGTEGQNCNWFTNVCEIPGAPPFTRIQGMDFDDSGRLHVLDIFHAAVSIFDPATGEYLGGYGEYGLENGQLKSPGSLLLEGSQALITDGGKNTIEVLASP